MTETNLNIVLTNALCCSGELACKVANLFAIGNKCANEELIKLTLLIDRINTICSYDFDNIDNNVLTEDQMNDMAHMIMVQCDICDCQLT